MNPSASEALAIRMIPCNNKNCLMIWDCTTLPIAKNLDAVCVPNGNTNIPFLMEIWNRLIYEGNVVLGINSGDEENIKMFKRIFLCGHEDITDNFLLLIGTKVADYGEAKLFEEEE
jgi:hypothetical protein